jgi:cyclophilin family peptidyl-prolyl cis-trans isomerase
LVILVAIGLLAVDHARAEDEDPYVILETNHGYITIKVYLSECPVTAGNFLNLSASGFYDGLTFHRVIPDFVIQGGDPDGDGSGGPGYHIPDENSSFALPHDYGALGMAHSGPGTAGSQFYIVLPREGLHYLDGRHAIFGTVLTGMYVAENISLVETDNYDKPVEDVIIVRAFVVDPVGPEISMPKEVTVTEGERAILNASGSSDNLGIVNWTWSFSQGGGTVYLYGPVVDVGFLEEGTYKVTLKVSDIVGNNVTKKVTVTVEPKEGDSPGLLLVPTIVSIAVVAVLVRRKRRS